jgi:hypothetical protein
MFLRNVAEDEPQILLVWPFYVTELVSRCRGCVFPRVIGTAVATRDLLFLGNGFNFPV